MARQWRRSVQKATFRALLFHRTGRESIIDITIRNKGGVQVRALTKLISVATVSFAALSLAVVPVSAETIPSPNQETVRPGDIRPVAEALSGEPGWYRTVFGSGASAEPTDAKAYNNQGSLEFNVTDPSSYVEVALINRLPSHRLADLGETGLSYATWQTTTDPQAVSLQVNVDYDVTDEFTGWQGRMVFEPYRNNVDTMGRTITDNTWQSWTTLEPEAVWWMTWSAGAEAQYGLSNPCPQSTPCTTAEVLDWFPNAGFNAGTGNALTLKAGSGWSNFTGYADVPYVGSTTNTYWDFEPALSTPTTKEQCKNDGWQGYTAQDGTPFKNQGQCVSMVARS